MNELSNTERVRADALRVGDVLVLPGDGMLMYREVATIEDVLVCPSGQKQFDGRRLTFTDDDGDVMIVPAHDDLTVRNWQEVSLEREEEARSGYPF